MVGKECPKTNIVISEIPEEQRKQCARTGGWSSLTKLKRPEIQIPNWTREPCGALNQMTGTPSLSAPERLESHRKPSNR